MNQRERRTQQPVNIQRPARRQHSRSAMFLSSRALILLAGASLCWALMALNGTSTASAQDKKLKPEELVAKHLEAIGTAEARAAAKTRVATCAVTMVLRVGGAGQLTGDAMMVSANTKLRFGMKFPVVEYPGEDVAFDGAKPATGFLPNGRRSNLSVFLNQQDLPLKEGLLGGALSTAWPLLRLEQQQPRLEYRGLKKVDKRELHELGYRARKGSSDLKVVLHFEPETFRHVRTHYSFQIGASIGTREAPNQNPESYYSLTEEFDDFRAVDGLTLPHKYRLQLSMQGNAPAALINQPADSPLRATGGPPSALYDWTLTVNRISHKDTFADQVFTIK
jgi:hypothetical protein